MPFDVWLALFVAGIREKEHPYAMLAEIGSMNMLENGGKQILPVIPQLIIPLKNALNTRDPEIMTRVMHVLQKLLDADELIGQVERAQDLQPTLLVILYAACCCATKCEFGWLPGARLSVPLSINIHRPWFLTTASCCQ